MKHTLSYIALALTAMSLSGCIDDTMDGCGREVPITYHVRLHTDLPTQLARELPYTDEAPIRNVLQKELEGVFSGVADELHLGFYHTVESPHLEQHNPGAKEMSYKIFLPGGENYHVASSNVGLEPLADLIGLDSHRQYNIKSADPDTIDNHRTGLFSGRKALQVEYHNGEEQHVNLYQVNSAAVIVVDLGDFEPDAMYCYTAGFADGFLAHDSIFLYDRTHVIRAKQVTDGLRHRAFYSVNLPSTGSLTKASSSQGLWSVKIIVKKDGKYTATTLAVTSPLQAGRMKILRTRLTQQGAVTSEDPEVGVSIELDWKPGSEQEIIV